MLVAQIFPAALLPPPPFSSERLLTYLFLLIQPQEQNTLSKYLRTFLGSHHRGSNVVPPQTETSLTVHCLPQSVRLFFNRATRLLSYQLRMGFVMQKALLLEICYVIY